MPQATGDGDGGCGGKLLGLGLPRLAEEVRELMTPSDDLSESAFTLVLSLSLLRLFPFHPIHCVGGGPSSKAASGWPR